MAEEELREREGAAVASSQEDLSQGHTSNVTGKGAALKSGGLKRNSLMIFGVAILVILLILILQVPIFAIDHISTSIIEQTDQQYTDEVKSKALVFQEGLKEGYVPEDTFERMEKEGVTIGYFEGETFIASNMTPYSLAAGENTAGITLGCEGDDCKTLSIKMGDMVIPADRFYYEVNNNLELYNAFTNSTYGRAGYYYDAEAQRVFRELGTSRNSFNGDESLDEVMDNLMGTGHNFGLSSQTWHYMPHWVIDDNTNPNSTAHIDEDAWTEKADSFSCSGDKSNNQIPYWNTYKIVVDYIVYNLDGTIRQIYYKAEDVPVYGDYGCITTDSNSFVRTLAQSNMSNTGDIPQTARNTVDTLKVADTVSKEKRSTLLYVGIAELFSKTKAGYGRSSNSQTDSILAAISTVGAVNGATDVNDVMNWLYDSTITTTIDTATGDPVESTGSAVESPSLYAILTGEMIEADEVKNYSSDRILTLAANKGNAVDVYTMSRTLASTSKSGSSNVSRCTETSQTVCAVADDSDQTMENATTRYDVEKMEGINYNNGITDPTKSAGVTASQPIIQSSLYDNSFETISGTNAGEMLVEGAVNLGKALAKASGSSAGNTQAVNSYLAMTKEVLAMDAAIDRINRSPLDVTSKNTFLGSIVYKFAVSSMKSGSLLNKIASVSKVAASAVKTILPSANAEDDEEDLYLATFGECETLKNIGATGSATCSAIATFDTSTYGGEYGTIYDETEFKTFLANNVDCSGSTCTPIKGSFLERYINYNELRSTPAGITDSDVIKSLANEDSQPSGGKVSLKDRVLALLNTLKEKLAGVVSALGISSVVKDKDFEIPPEATGAAFVVGNTEWEDYKYAQRYVSLARAAETLRQYSGDATAYNFEGFGLGNPVARYIEKVSGDTIATE